jgi:hypothetical protein
VKAFMEILIVGFLRASGIDRPVLGLSAVQ